jgi:SNF2 family DNA or RNA helicase
VSLTGTPLENRIDDLISILDFVVLGPAMDVRLPGEQ